MVVRSTRSAPRRGTRAVRKAALSFPLIAMSLAGPPTALASPVAVKEIGPNETGPTESGLNQSGLNQIGPMRSSPMRSGRMGSGAIRSRCPKSGPLRRHHARRAT